MSQYWSAAANSCSLTRFKKRLDGQKHRDALCMKMDYFRVAVCWVATTIICAPIKLISQFSECSYGSFGCIPASIHAYTSSKWGTSGTFACAQITVYMARSFTVKFQVQNMKTWIQNHQSVGGSVAKISCLLCLLLFNKYHHDLPRVNRTMF